MIRRDILRPWVLYNWGEKALHLIPLVSLGHTSPQDQAAYLTAASTAGYTLHPSQFAEIDEILNLPVRDLTQEDAPQPAPTTPPAPPNQPKPDAPPKPPAKMSGDEVQPKIGRRPGKPNGAYSAEDRRLLVDLFDDAFPESAGLLDAKVQGGE
jgi:hypothetical protein